MKKTFLLKVITVAFVVAMVCVIVAGCMRKDSGFSADNDYAASSLNPAATSAPDESSLPTATETSAETTPGDTPDVTESVIPVPTLTATPENLHAEIAESFFRGTWKSTSGMLYIFDGENREVTLKDVSTGEVLLEGSYESSTEDFSEYRLSMTFHGETDSFIAWRYSDSGAVRLIIEETGATYDLLYRVTDN